MKVAILFGGKSSEYSVSLSSAYSTLQYFPTEYELIKIGISETGHFFEGNFSLEEIEKDTWQKNPTAREVMVKPGDESTFFYLDDLSTFQVDVAFNMIHGKQGEDGVLQALLSTGGIEYTGCDQESSLLCYDKEITHRLLDLTSIRKAQYETLTQLLDEADYEKLVAKLGEKLVIKPAREGSSYGISITNNFTEFNVGLANALNYDQKVIVEEFIEGFEIGCAVLEKEGELITGECDEIELHTAFFDFEAKYEYKDAQVHCPARISPEISNECKDTAKRIFKLMGCRDFARVDFFVSKDQQLYFNEINTIPGFTSHSRFPSMMKQVGVSFTEIIRSLVENARKRHA